MRRAKELGRGVKVSKSERVSRKRKLHYTMEYDDRTKIRFTTLVVGSCPAA